MAEEVTETRIRTMSNIGIIIAIGLITTATILIPTQKPEEMHTVTFTPIITMPIMFLLVSTLTILFILINRCPN